MEHFFCLDVQTHPNDDPYSSHGHTCSYTYPHHFLACYEEVNRAPEIPEMAIWLGNRCHCLLLSSHKGYFVHKLLLCQEIYLYWSLSSFLRLGLAQCSSPQIRFGW